MKEAEVLNSIPVFGEARADRFMRKTNKEIRIMNQEDEEDNIELAMFFDYEYEDDMDDFEDHDLFDDEPQEDEIEETFFGFMY